MLYGLVESSFATQAAIVSASVVRRAKNETVHLNPLRWNSASIFVCVRLMDFLDTFPILSAENTFFPVPETTRWQQSTVTVSLELAKGNFRPVSFTASFLLRELDSVS